MYRNFFLHQIISRLVPRLWQNKYLIVIKRNIGIILSYAEL
jgi:hypothetical protein